MWAGTWSGGINILHANGLGDKFAHFKMIAGDENSLSSNLVLCINGDNDGNVWVGTDGGGLNRIAWTTKSFTHYLSKPLDQNGPRSNYPLYISNISADILAIGYHRMGFDLLNQKTGRFTHYMPPDRPGETSGVSVRAVFMDKRSRLWIGAWLDGLYLYNESDLFLARKGEIPHIHYKQDSHNAESIGGSTVYTLREDKEGNLWMGTNGGLDRYDEKNNRFIHYRYNVNNKDGLSNDVVHSITEDHNGNLWLGTGGGLNFFDKGKQTFTSYTTKDGLSNNVVYGILEDDHGNLWFSSNQGLSKFNPATKVCRNYGISDGLQGNSFKPNAYYKSKTGEMFFGGTNGFNVFHPDSIKDNPFIPPVWITGLQIFNKPVEIGENSPLPRDISELSSIKISYEQSVFTVEFAALNYISPQMNQYAYKLEGFDKNWNYVGNNRTATYTNLDPGEYTFKVKGSNNDGVWNSKNTTLKITITPPFWKTLWFRSLVVLSFAYGILFFYRARVSTIQKQKTKLKKKVKKRTLRITKMNEEIKRQAQEIKAINENLEQLVQLRTIQLERKNKALKEYAFINAHKVRGPLASILGLIDLISRMDLPSEYDEMMTHLRQSAENLDSVVRSITKMIEDEESVGHQGKK
jgi:hypothetical protein